MNRISVSQLSLTGFRNGELDQLFDIQLKKVLENIADVNTGLKPREINIKVAFKPDKDRSMCSISASVDSKLCPDNPVEIRAAIDVDNAFEIFPEQNMELFDGKIKSFNEERKRREL